MGWAWREGEFDWRECWKREGKRMAGNQRSSAERAFAEVACRTRPVLCAKQKKGRKGLRGTPNLAERIVSKATATETVKAETKDGEEENRDTVVALCHRLLELHQRSVWLAEHNRAALAELSARDSDGE